MLEEGDDSVVLAERGEGVVCDLRPGTGGAVVFGRGEEEGGVGDVEVGEEGVEGADGGEGRGERVGVVFEEGHSWVVVGLWDVG